MAVVIGAAGAVAVVLARSGEESASTAPVPSCRQAGKEKVGNSCCAQIRGASLANAGVIDTGRE